MIPAMNPPVALTQQQIADENAARVAKAEALEEKRRQMRLNDGTTVNLKEAEPVSPNFDPYKNCEVHCNHDLVMGLTIEDLWGPEDGTYVQKKVNLGGWGQGAMILGDQNG